MNTQKEAANRIYRAETLLRYAIRNLDEAQASISVVVWGLNQNHPKIGALRENIKVQIFDLQRCRRSGLCDLDSTATAALGKRRRRS
jgi:hypothetical protein